MCSESVLRKINKCDEVSKWFSCSDCIEQFESFAPAQHFDLRSRGLSDTQFGDVCVVATMEMLLNCDNRTPDHRRLCPCLSLDVQAEVKDNSINHNDSVRDEKTESIKIDDKGLEAV